MNTALFEQLLNEEEGSALDFKRDQYQFYGASDEDKGELLKDILAFANAWRRTPAYVLIGVDERAGGPAVVVGVTQHLKDADLQQFVNTKTQRPIDFSYSVFEFEGKQVAVIEIPVQSRPFYLTKRFGKIEAEVVLVRRGSSTARATPDEVARMGRAEVVIDSPALTMQFADGDSRTLYGTEITIEPVNLTPLSVHEFLPPDPYRRMVPLRLGEPDEEYYAELIAYTREQNLLVPLDLAVSNESSTVATDVVARAMIIKQPGVYLADTPPVRPSPNRHLSMLSTLTQAPIRSVHSRKPTPDVHDRGDRWEVEIPFGTIHPRVTVWTGYPIYVGAEQSLTLPIELSLSGANLPQLVKAGLVLNISREARAMTVEDTRE